MLRKILVGTAALIAALIAGFMLLVFSRPAAFHVERAVGIAAPPENAFALVNDFHAWPAWSPWEKLDPQMKKTFEGPPAGVGSKYAWSGNADVGEGRMTLEQSEKPSLIGIKLEFLKPFAATNTTTFKFARVGEGSQVTWAMDGQNNFMAKAASIFMDMDKMIGGDFERGLAALKAAAEAAPKAAAADTQPTPAEPAAP